jgi:Na+/proline symporter
MTSLQQWSWVFFVVYLVVMLTAGAIGQRRVRSADDFAVARSAYGPWTLAVAFAATMASGATFLGLPALAYAIGLSALWIGLIYPIAIFGGLWLCRRVLTRAGHGFGSRSIPEFLGDRFQSEALRVLTALASLALLTLLAGQLVAGLTMFEVMLGLPAPWALVITTAILLAYVTLGGAHADILTDAVQGALMLAIALGVAAMFGAGVGAGGWDRLVERLLATDPALLAPVNPASPVTGSTWDLVALVLAYLPFGFLPYLGNKLWALRSAAEQNRFLLIGFVCGLVLPLATLAGLLARAVFGDALFTSDLNPNGAIIALFVEVLPAWLAALLGTAILAAVMSTADGLVISSSQVFANDLYRRTIAPRLHGHLDAVELERRVLQVSRAGTIVTLLLAMAIAWVTLDRNIILLTWLGLGSVVAGLAAPLMVGSLWRRMTAPGAICGFLVGSAGFIVLHYGLLPAGSFDGTALEAVGHWLSRQAPNPYACAAIAELTGIAVSVIVSLCTRPLPEAHLRVVFDGAG